MPMFSSQGRGFTKPPPGCRINWGHPLTRGLAECVLYNEGNGPNPRSILYDEKVVLVSADSSRLWTSGNQGVVRRFDTGGSPNLHLETLTNIPQRNLLGAVSLHVGLAPLGASNESAFREVVNRRVNGGVNSGIEYGIYYNNNQGINFYWANASTFQSVILVQNSLMTQYQFCTLTGARAAAATSGKLWRSGVQLASTSGLSVPTASGTTFNIGCDSDFTTDPLFANIYYIYMWNRELSASEVQWLNAEPYSFIMSEPYRRYFAPPAPSGISASDSVSVTESVTVQIQTTPSVSDSVTVAESAADTIADQASVNNSVTVSDVVTMGTPFTSINASVSSAITVSENVTVSTPIRVSVFEYLTVIDAPILNVFNPNLQAQMYINGRPFNWIVSS